MEKDKRQAQSSISRTVKNDMSIKKVIEIMILDRKKWWKRIYVAGPN